jgi:hypothetical protein
MNKKELLEVIRKVIKTEVKKAVKVEFTRLTESMKLNEDNSNDEWPTLNNRQISSQDVHSFRAKFAEMNDGIFSRESSPIPTVDIANRPVNPEKIDPSVRKALTRDYSELMKRFK